MQPLFPRWSNSAARAVVLLVVAAPLAAVALLMALVRSPYVKEHLVHVEQPIAFDHRHHVRDDEIDCRYCHSLVERSPYAGVPPVELCMGCHDQIWNDAALLEPLRRAYFGSTPLVWRRVNRLPDFVYFHHAAHVARGVGCSSCHGRVDRMASVYQPVPMTMAWCLECHRDPTPHLRPLERITDMSWPAPPSLVTGLSFDTSAARARIAGDQREVRPPTSCSGCHR